jgi:hypothetical protein
MGFFDEVGSSMEEPRIQRAMDSIGAYKGTHSENYERCQYYVSPPASGSKYYGGCVQYQINVFSSYVCNNFSR